MTPANAKTALIAVLQRIQARGGLPCPPLNGASVPPRVLEKFDSTVWPAATTMVARELGVRLPNDVHVFGGEGGAPLLSIDEAANLICRRALPRMPQQVAA